MLELSGEGYICITISKLSLLAGKYSLGIGIYDEQVVQYDCIDRCAEFEMLSTKGDLGIARLDNEWEILTRNPGNEQEEQNIR